MILDERVEFCDAIDAKINATNNILGDVIDIGPMQTFTTPLTSVTFTNSSDLVNWTGHGLPIGTPVVFPTVTTTTGITAGTTYYVSAQSIATNAFRVSTTLANAIAGTSVTLDTGDGTGTAIATPVALKNLGNGEPIYLVIQVTTAGAGAGNITFELWSDSVVAGTNKTVHATTGAIAFTSYTLGKNIIIAVPNDNTFQQYVGIWETGSGNTTALGVNIFLTHDVSSLRSYADAAN